MRGLVRKAATAAILLGIGCALPASAGASPFNPSGLIKVAKTAHANLNSSQSSNWFGYNAGALDRGTLFDSISSDWTVPTVSQHAAGQAGDSATWIGIGGGCLSATCTLTDATLIQAGTEQDVDSAGHPSYSAWWELVPAPGITINNFNVSPGDHIHASISEAVPGSEVWTIALSDTTKGENFSTTVPYTSTQSTAEWIDETPITFGSGGVGEATLPNLSQTQFSGTSINGAGAQLSSGEMVQLIDGGGHVIATPSVPYAGGAAFTDCAWASSCATPSVAGPVTHATHKAKHKRRKHHKRKRRRRAHRRTSSRRG